MLPDFVGIGVPRGGSTWLHELLAAHPQIYVPVRRKEVAYFHAYYDRGPDWYADFFPPDDQAGSYAAVGEVTPGYLYSADAARRISEMTSVKRLLLMLRHPVDRLYSQYVWLLRNYGYRGDFDRFLVDHADRKDESHYVRHLEEYLRYFSLDQIKILITEEAIAEPQPAARSICEFLQADPDAMPSAAGEKQVNASSVPRFRGAFAVASTFRRFLRRHDLDFVVSLGRNVGIKRMLLGNSNRQQAQPMSGDTHRRLEDEFAPDVEQLESLLGRSIDAWKGGRAADKSALVETTEGEPQPVHT